ncbi:methyltransferase small [Streptomyces sp. GBA 94-10 4N24]|nr:methyltransferase small [Streptomyces sp. GBA 94-10 4N24]ESQ03226.1 methyltransferase small [Streptomyces sp. PVA_94-07]UZN61477.1 methyltransferase small [Streptomyces sp. GBA 94-10 4N24]
MLRVLAAESGQKLTLFRSQGREVDTVVIEFQMRELTAE